MSASMAEVIREHAFTEDDTCACTCDEMFYDWRLSADQLKVEHSLHVEERLAAAGYGKLEPCTRPHLVKAPVEGHCWPGELTSDRRPE